MKVCVLSSGSKGNSTYVETRNHKILIDIGTSCLYIENSLKSINVLKHLMILKIPMHILLKIMIAQ